MEKAKLKYIEEQCNRIADGMERISGFTGKGQLYIYEHVDIQNQISYRKSGADRAIYGKSKRQYKSNHQIYRTLCNTVGRVSPGDLERRSKRRDKGRWGDRTFRTG